MKSGDGQSARAGAMINNNYVSKNEDICPVPASVIEDNAASAKEEIWQYSIGGFLCSGSFWLGLERLLTEGLADTLFLACTAFFLAGAVISFTGYRQAKRRLTRLQRYLPEDK